MYIVSYGTGAKCGLFERPDHFYRACAETNHFYKTCAGVWLLQQSVQQYLTINNVQRDNNDISHLTRSHFPEFSISGAKSRS